MSNHTLYYDDKTERYFARVQVGNVRKRFWFGSNAKDARDDLNKTLKKIACGEIPFTTATSTAIITNGKKDMHIKELAHRHLEWVQKNRSAGTYQLRKKYIQAFLDFVGDCNVVDITRIMLEDFYAHARTNFGRSANGGNEHLSNVKTMFLWAEEMDICDRPVRRFPKIRRMPPATDRVPVKDLRKLLFSIPLDLCDMVLFGLFSGLRPQELRNLRREHVNLHDDGTSTIVIQRHKTSASAREPVPRSMPLCEAALEIVERQLAVHPGSEYVFVNAAGTPYTKDVLRRRLRRQSKAIGIKTVTPYSLRHTFASMQAESGTNQLSLAQLMGHTSPRTTARYVHNSDEHYRKVMSRQADMVKGLLEPQDARKIA